MMAASKSLSNQLDVISYNNTAERCFVNTVRDIKTNYSVRDYKMAEYSRQIYYTIVRPSIHDFTKLVENN